MFTGIIEDIGKVVEVKKNFLFIETSLGDINIKDSISVNGVCLTVIDIDKKEEKSLFKVELSDETLNRTNLKFVKPNTLVNLERAVKPTTPLGGHFVFGHIDTTIKLLKIIKEEFEFELPKEYKKYIVEKGSVAIDGISLTVAKKYKDRFSVIILPYTLENTTLKIKKVGDLFNLEVDILAKYVESIISKEQNIDLEFLKKHGFA
jgi:riboflavin synthase